MKIALLQLNYTVGDVAGNAQRIAAAVRQAVRDGAELCVTSELALIGYPPRDLLLYPATIATVWRVLQELAEELRECGSVIVGAPEPNPQPQGRPLFNAAVLLRDGQIRDRFRKTLLPNYDVFHEARYFEPAPGDYVYAHAGQRLGISICEDVWNDPLATPRRYPEDPIQRLVGQGCHAILNLSASPFAAGKQAIREQLGAHTARRLQAPLCFVNQVGGNDDLVFDGRSFVLNAAGELVAQAAMDEEATLLVDLAALPAPALVTPMPPEEEIWRALVLGTRDYVRKCGFSSVVLGLSGGIDSALTAVIAVEALGAAQVLGVLMPSPYSSAGSVADARALAQQLGIRTQEIPIDVLMQGYEHALAPSFAQSPKSGAHPTATHENIQARIRGNLLMALSNELGALLLTTGNKSELAVGYCTLYGDMSGGLAVLSDVPKTMVYRLARWRNQQRGEIVSEAILTKAPSAELRLKQTDQDSLPPYELLDEILQRHIEHLQSPQTMIAEGLPASEVARVVALIQTAEFKRRQAAPGIKVTDRAFGTGWMMPIACRHPREGS